METKLFTSPWAIVPEKLKEITEVYRNLKEDRINFSGMEAVSGQPLKGRLQGYEVKDSVAVIDIQNIITKKLNFLSIFFGGTSSQHVTEIFKEALDNPEVKSILLYIDSPGGSVDGTAELANLIYESRGEKRIIAFTDGMMVSAAYWIGSAADEVYISGDTTQTGSIGIVATHIDISKAEKMVGIKTTIITAGRYKSIASRYKPLSDEGKTDIQEKVDHVYSVFVSDTAKFRGVSVEKVLFSMADGKVFIGTQAIDAGLVDGVSTMDGLISRLASGAPVKKPTQRDSVRRESSMAMKTEQKIQRTEVKTMEKKLTFEEQVIQDWKSKPEIRAEFKKFSVYEAYMKAEKAGRVTIIGGRIVK